MDQMASINSSRLAPGRGDDEQQHKKTQQGAQVIEAKVIQVPTRSRRRMSFDGHHLVAVYVFIQVMALLCSAVDLQLGPRREQTWLIGQHLNEGRTRREAPIGPDETAATNEAAAEAAGGFGLAGDDEQLLMEDEQDEETDGQWLPLNESLQLLLDDRIINDNDLVVKRPAPQPAAAASQQSIEASQPIKAIPRTTTTTKTITSISRGGDSEGHLHDHGESGPTASSSQARRVQRLLVRQLTSLMMNNEPEQIAENIGESTRVSGQIMSETSQSMASGNNHKVNDDDDHGNINKKTTMSLGSSQAWPLSDGDSEIHRRESSSSSSSSSLPSNTINNINDNNDSNNNQTNPEQYNNLNNDLEESTNQMAMAGFQEDTAITCPPDYEDLEGSAASAGNLTVEQQQQLLSDSSALLINSTSANSTTSQLFSSSSDIQQQTSNSNNKHLQHIANNNQQLRHQLMAQCYHQGLQRIEFIVKVITPILFGVIIVVGLLGNIIVMLVILEDRKTERELTPTNLLILDLSLADLSFIIFCIPFTAWDYAVSHWVFGPLWCKFNQYLIVVCALSSIYTLVLMSVDRFMAIVYPIECISYRTSKNMLHAIYIKWIIILLIALPTWKMHGLIDSSFGPDHYDCRLLADQYNPLHFQIIFFITSYLFPLILIFCLYFGLLQKLWFGSKPHGHKESLKMLESKKKVTWLVAGIVIVFAACWCPIQVMLILMRLKAYKITPTYVALQVFSHTLGYMNSCVNPIVYAFASETFHQSFKRSWLGRAFNWMFCTDCCSVSNSGGGNNTITNLNNYGGTNHHHQHNNGHSAIVGMHSNTDGHYLSAGGGSTRSASNHHLSTRFMSTRLSEQHQTMSSLTAGQQLNVNNNNNTKLRNQSLNHIFTSTGSSSSTPPHAMANQQPPQPGKLISGNNNNNNNQERSSPDNDGSCCTSTLMITNTTPQHSLRSDSNNNDISQSNGNLRLVSTAASSSRQPLPLEPRDRPTVLMTRGSSSTSQPLGSPTQRVGPETSIGAATPDDDLSSQQRSPPATGQVRLIPRQPTASGSFVLTSSPERPLIAPEVPKQRLVAQMVSQTSANGNQQVAHRCEPIDVQQHPQEP